MPKKPLHMEIHLSSAKGNFFTDISPVLRATQPCGQTSLSLQRALLGIKQELWALGFCYYPLHGDLSHIQIHTQPLEMTLVPNQY